MDDAMSVAKDNGLLVGEIGGHVIVGEIGGHVNVNVSTMRVYLYRIRVIYKIPDPKMSYMTFTGTYITWLMRDNPIRHISNNQGPRGFSLHHIYGTG